MYGLEEAYIMELNGDSPSTYDRLRPTTPRGPTQLPYIVNKKRSKNNVEIMQSTERSLDALWDEYDSHMMKYLEPAVNTLLQSAMP
jgi:hypothetical protein